MMSNGWRSKDPPSSCGWVVLWGWVGRRLPIGGMTQEFVQGAAQEKRSVVPQRDDVCGGFDITEPSPSQATVLMSYAAQRT